MKRFGWKRDLPDQRDLLYTTTNIVLPVSIDLRPECPAIYDQGNLGSCTANAIAAHLDFNRQKQGETLINPSRLFIYYNERVIEGTVKSDSGASMRDSIKEVVKYGACPETEWPYLIKSFAKKPTTVCYSDAVKAEALAYQRILRNETSMKSCLAEGFPFVIGITVYESFHKADTDGKVPMPAKNEQVLGGHAILVVGYDQNGWICRNSWGTSWGLQGYFYLPMKYLLTSALSADSWTLRQVK